MNNVTSDGQINWEKKIRVPTSQKKLKKYLVLAGDILFNNTNSAELVGKTAFFDGYEEPVVFSNHFTRIKSNEEYFSWGIFSALFSRKKKR
ncbi:MAG: hypothetical protein R1F54_05645 [Candidatus Zeuxoniibacter abyssi]|nr:MAG: hypothetical protein R1F54_05645 [Candidatus Persebacteraceae bacterium AB1(2)]